MDNNNNNKSPRSREILGPRPSPLKIRKDSHKIIKKPPLAPQPPPELHQQEPSQPPTRGPVIIYTVSPKVIHTHPNNFMTLVQRLTGKTSIPTSSSTDTSTSREASSAFDGSRGAISPAARYAAMEKANISNEMGFMGSVETTIDQYYHHHHQNRMVERPNSYHAGILSPGPTSLPSISPDLFSTVGPTDPQGLLSFYNDFSSILQTSPSTTQSPSSNMDHFNNFFYS